MKWREENNIDSITESFPKHEHFERVVSYWPGSLHWTDPGITKDDSIILLQALGRADPTIVQTVGKETLVQYHIWCMENLEKIFTRTVEEKGYWPGFVMVEDLQGVGYHTFTPTVLGMAQELSNITRNYYPDMLRKMYIINVPSIFWLFWKGMQVWMEPRSVGKMELISGNVSVVADKFQAIFDMSTIPERLGGNSTRDIPLGGYIGVPQTKFREKAKNRVDIPRGSKHSVNYHFEKDDIVSWEFKVKFYDIGFAIYFMENNMEEIHNSDRCEDKKVFSGHMDIERTGTYVFVWDNSYSWTRSKNVKFNVYKGLDVIN